MANYESLQHNSNNNEHLEVERTFLVVRPPRDLRRYDSKHIRQGYISEPTDDIEIRLRQFGNNYELTTKMPVSAGDYSQFIEQTTVLSKQEFQQQWRQVRRTLEKQRYYYPLTQSLIAEVDVFQASLRGLVIAEVEFPNTEMYMEFTHPVWFGRDITQERWIAGKNLAGKSLRDLREFLA